MAWLPKDERRMLAFYARNLDKLTNYIGTEPLKENVTYEKSRINRALDWPFYLRRVPEYGDNDSPPKSVGWIYGLKSSVRRSLLSVRRVLHRRKEFGQWIGDKNKSRMRQLLRRSCAALRYSYADRKREMRYYLKQRKRVENASHFLAQRGLIAVEHHQTDSDVILITMTLEGYDLGKRLSTPWGWVGVHYQETKSGLFWWVVGSVLIGGILVAVAKDWLKEKVIPHKETSPSASPSATASPP